jgi:DNA-binding Lrp family transcriptional regulator
MSDTELKHLRTNLAVVQHPLKLISEPFSVYAEKLNCSQEALFELLCDYCANGIIRRIAGVLKHDKAGFIVNAMVAIEIPPEECDAVGTALGHFLFITHCYRRTSYPDWPFTLYAMVHAKSDEEFNEYIGRIKEVTGERTIVVLKSLKEYKKTTFRIEEKMDGL